MLIRSYELSLRKGTLALRAINCQGKSGEQNESDLVRQRINPFHRAMEANAFPSCLTKKDSENICTREVKLKMFNFVVFLSQPLITIIANKQLMCTQQIVHMIQSASLYTMLWKRSKNSLKEVIQITKHRHLVSKWSDKPTNILYSDR